MLIFIVYKNNFMVHVNTNKATLAFNSQTYLSLSFYLSPPPDLSIGIG